MGLSFSSLFHKLIGKRNRRILIGAFLTLAGHALSCFSVSEFIQLDLMRLARRPFCISSNLGVSSPVSLLKVYYVARRSHGCIGVNSLITMYRTQGYFVHPIQWMWAHIWLIRLYYYILLCCQYNLPHSIGFNVESVEYKNISITSWSLGGKDNFRPLWGHYYVNAQVRLIRKLGNYKKINWTVL